MSKQTGEGAAEEAGKLKGTTFQVSLLRCRKTNRVLFLEAGKDFVDTLFSFLLLPVGTIINLLSKGVQASKPLGEISSIFESVGRLECSLLHVHRKYLMKPRPAAANSCVSTGLLQGLEVAKEQGPLRTVFPTVYYNCEGCHQMSITPNKICETCCRNGYTRYVTTKCTLAQDEIEEFYEALLGNPDDSGEASQGSAGQGFVKESITYMVTDNLEVMPATTIRTINVLNKLMIATLADLESSDTTVTVTEVLQLLQSALTSNTCLNDVFGKK